LEPGTWNRIPEPVGPTRWRFLPPAEWPDEDLVNLGADLEPPTVIAGYRLGLFPMEVTGLPGVLGWWSPVLRGILPLDGLRVTKSLKQSAKKFEVRVNTCFTRVMRECANPKRESGWITDEFIRAYTTLHEMGWAHSVEAFDKSGELAGGLYGVKVGRMFAGESMFFKQRDASKVALMALVDLMKQTGMTLLDVQWKTEHLATLGVVEIPRVEYLRRVSEAVG
jgi:leucyl/phenylalanyl-tRNA--protein transferase